MRCTGRLGAATVAIGASWLGVGELGSLGRSTHHYMKELQRRIEIYEANDAVLFRQFCRSRDHYRKLYSETLLAASDDISASANTNLVRAFAGYLRVVPRDDRQIAVSHIQKHPAEAKRFLQIADTVDRAFCPLCDELVSESTSWEVFPYWPASVRVLERLWNAA